MMTAENTNLHEMLVAEVARQTSEESVRALVEKNIADIVKSSVESAFRWGDVRKSIETAVQESLQVPARIDIPSYSNMILGLLRGMIDDRLSDLVNQQLADQLEEILGLGAQELKLSDLVKELIEDQDKETRYYSHVTCIVEESDSSDGYYRIYLDNEDKTSKYSCELQIAVTPDGKIYSLNIDGKDAKTRIHVGFMESWKKKVFALFVTGGKFVLDDKDPSTSIGDW
ncbi:hypothetical protein ACRRRS_21800 (plasmid) [Brucella anthropi]|uniref:hypothetical protein n=1 Tax=Brucella anthropi TaxID=529 RepID=UPI003D7D85E7